MTQEIISTWTVALHWIYTVNDKNSIIIQLHVIINWMTIAASLKICWLWPSMFVTGCIKLTVPLNDQL